MIKSAPYIPIASIFSLVFLLIIPYWLVQMICIGFLLIVLISFLYVKLLERSIKVERRLKKLKLSCQEQSDITFTIKNYSRMHVILYLL